MARYPTGNPPLTLDQCRYFGKLFWGLFGFTYIAYILYTVISILKRGRGINI